MIEQDYELLSQYLDGELPAQDAQNLRKRLLAEPQLREQFDRLRKMDSGVKDAFSQPDINTVPARITNMVENSPKRKNALLAHRRTGWGLAVAASLVAATGLILSDGWQQSQEQYPGTGSDAQLAQLLESTPSHSESWDVLTDGRQVRPLLSFQSKTGDWCREYLMSSAGTTWRGVACRNAGTWGTAVLSPEEFIAPGSQYRTAGAADSDQIATFIDENAADIALNRQQEAELISRHWQ